MPMYPRRTFRSVASTGWRSSARWRRRKASRSTSLAKKGLPVPEGPSVWAGALSSRSMASSRVMASSWPGNSSSMAMAVPRATMVSGCSGRTMSASFRFSRSANTRTKVGLKVRGPPSKMMGAVSSRPWDSPPMVCLAMAWKVDRAMSDRSAPWISRGWMSVLANTPHRPEMLYTVSPCSASCSNSSAGTFSRAAISSMKAPVPPAQLPFIRISEVWSFPVASS